MILSNGEDFNIYGEERISTESDEERLTYISGLNQSVFATITQDKTPEQKDDIMITVSYDDAGNSVDMVNGFGYNGEKADESGNIYLRARYYNPRISQFVQIDSYRGTQDSISSQQRYTYCANNQYKYVDPNGHFVFTTMGIIGAAWIGLGFGTAIGIGYAGYKKVEKINKERESNTLSKGAGTVSDVAEEAISKTTPKDKPKKTTTGKEKTTKTDKNKVSNTVTKEVEPEPCVTDKLKDTNGALDAIQTLISIIGFIPAIGDILDALNGFISFLRGKYLDAIIDIGSAVLSTVGDTLLKPFRWLKKSVGDMAVEIVKNCPNFTKIISKGVNRVAGIVDDCILIPKSVKKFVSNTADKFNNYIDKIFRHLNPRTGIPRKNGKWLGDVPGECRWMPDSTEVLSITKGKGIPFKDGRPVFDEFVTEPELVFDLGELIGDRTADASLCYEKLMKKHGLPSKKAAEKWVKSNGYTLHHKTTRTIQLVPTKLHKNVWHIGSASDLKNYFNMLR